MGKKWIVHTLAENVEFRILKSGRDSALYEKTWKSALVGFSTSSDALDHLMTVEYSYGKRIDIAVNNSLQSSFCFKVYFNCNTNVFIRWYFNKVMIPSYVFMSVFVLESYL